MQEPFYDTFTGRPCAVSAAAGHFDVFAGGSNGHLWHWWWVEVEDHNDPGHGDKFGPEDCGGDLSGDPVAVSAAVDWVDVFARTVAQELAWRSFHPGGLPDWQTLAPVIAYDPVVGSFAEQRMDVFVPSFNGSTLRHWSFDHDHFNGEWDYPWAGGMPTITPVGDGYEIFGRSDDGRLHWYHCAPDADPGWEEITDPPLQFPASSELLVVQRPQDGRLDLFCSEASGELTHWGLWNGWHWFGPETGAPHVLGQIEPGTLSAVAGRSYTMVGRTLEGRLGTVDFIDPFVDSFGIGHDGFWRVDQFNEQIIGPPCGIVRRDGKESMLAFVDLPADEGTGAPPGVYLVHYFLGVGWTWESWQPTTEVDEIETWTAPEVGGTAKFTATRSEDLAVLEVSWEDFTPRAEAGEIEATGPKPRLSITLPPQHLKEGMFGPFDELNSASQAQAVSSGPSRIDLEIPPGTVIPLTTDGVLAALGRAGAKVAAFVPAERAGTVIEMPTGLAFTPTNAEVVGQQPDPARSERGNTAIWRLAIGAAGAGSMLYDPIAVDEERDWFDSALPRANRATIASLPTQARISELALSALGGTMSVAGDWGTFAWDHHIVLGRDQRVRARRIGVLYPLGLRAEYLEVSHREIRFSDAQPVAGLRITRTLTVTQPVLDLTTNGMRRDFPFTRVEALTTVVNDLSVPGWTREPRTLDTARLRAVLEQCEISLLSLLGTYVFPPGLIEHHADEFEVAGYIGLLRERARILKALNSGSWGQDVDVFFTPHAADGSPTLFDVVLTGTAGPVRVSMPMIFVADIQLPAEFSFNAYTSLGNPDVARALRCAYEPRGPVHLASTIIDLVAASAPADQHLHEVRALNFGASPEPGGFIPRLGYLADPTDPLTFPERYGAGVALPALRQLLDKDATATVAYTAEYLADPAHDIAVAMLGPVTSVLVGFAELPARAGGLATPEVVADAISRTHGLVQKVGLAVGAVDHLDPAKILGGNAKLLGANLINLVKPEALKVPPAIISLLDGNTPVSKLTWSNIALKSAVPLKADNGRLTIEITAGGAIPKATSTITDVALALPAAKPLLTLHFASLTFTQTSAARPDLTVGPVNAEFSDLLNLIKKLQEAVDLGDLGPQIDVSPRSVTARYTLAVPEVSCGVFVMRNIAFSAAIEVPFDNRPVTLSLDFASRLSPFNLSVAMFGGGGYLSITLDSGGIRRFEAALEFGASIAVNFLVARGEVHALGGVRYVQDAAGAVSLSGFLRLGGTVEVLGLVSVAVELLISLTYDDGSNQSPMLATPRPAPRMVGRATLVIDIDLTLISFSTEIDSGEWVLIGGDQRPTPVMGRGGVGPPPPRDTLRFREGPPRPTPQEEWQRYRRAFVGAVHE